ncbi:MAG TPA: hypothetical protein PKJ68_04505 [Candidatus Woesebacteria bacterium]|nr:hypothetical protein [Candidatus Woesebacteria bacterium]
MKNTKNNQEFNDWTKMAIMLIDRAFVSAEKNINTCKKVGVIVKKKYPNTEHHEIEYFVAGYMGIPYDTLQEL